MTKPDNDETPEADAKSAEKLKGQVATGVRLIDGKPGLDSTADEQAAGSTGSGGVSRPALARVPSTGWEVVPLFIHISVEFAKMPDGEAKLNFAKAIQKSFSIDVSGRPTPNPASPVDIENEYGFSIVAQKKYRMAFGKDIAFKELLEPINAPVNLGLYKKLTKETYRVRFGREPFILYQKQMVLTAAEWLHFVPYEFQCPIPVIVEQYLGT